MKIPLHHHQSHPLKMGIPGRRNVDFRWDGHDGVAMGFIGYHMLSLYYYCCFISLQIYIYIYTLYIYIRYIIYALYIHYT